MTWNARACRQEICKDFLAASSRTHRFGEENPLSIFGCRSLHLIEYGAGADALAIRFPETMTGGRRCGRPDLDGETSAIGSETT
jgi:hypothetical protein